MRLDLLAALNAERRARRAAVLVTDLEDGSQRLVRAAEAADDPLAAPILEAIRSGRAGRVDADGRALFMTLAAPPVRVVICGAVHIAQTLAPMAAMLGFDARIVDPRTAFATPERFPGVAIDAAWPDEAFATRPLDAYTALVALTHDPKIDDPALAEALRAGCFYVGALGSRKTHARRVERLTAAGFDDGAIARIHAPVGLDIGAASPPEIAVAVLAQIVAVLRARR